MRLLAICFSQSGQLDEILDQFLKAFPSHVDIDRIHVRAQAPFPFPWTIETFFDAMPDAVLENPCKIAPPSFKHDWYDLIVLGYQPWFLSPSTPTTALLCDDNFAARLNNTPAVTLIGSRNMWLQAHDSVTDAINDAAGNLVGNIPLVDRAPNLVSAVTMLHWMLGGQKTRMWGLFPMPGVSQYDILNCRKAGEIVHRHVEKGTLKSLQEALDATQVAPRSAYLAFLEFNGKRVFTRVAKLVNSAPPGSTRRRFILTVFRLYLGFALFVVSPFVFVIFQLLTLPSKLWSSERKGIGESHRTPAR